MWNKLAKTCLHITRWQNSDTIFSLRGLILRLFDFILTLRQIKTLPSFSLIIASLFSLNSCSPSVPYKYITPVSGPVNENVDSDATGLWKSPLFDILFVVDDSGSMADYQANLSANIDLFTKEFFKGSLIDYHIGVITTDMDRAYKAGKLQGYPLYIDKTTVNPIDKLANNLIVGTNGSASEMIFDPIYEALTTHVNGYNSGFYRPDAHLVVIIITDAADQSVKMNNTKLLNFLNTLKLNQPDMLMTFGAIIPSTVKDTWKCPRDDGTLPLTIEGFLKATDPTGSNILNLCENDFGKKMAQFGRDIFLKASAELYLDSWPVVETIQVMYGNYVIPPAAVNGWVYNPEKNSIRLNELEWQNLPLNQKLHIKYQKATGAKVLGSF